MTKTTPKLYPQCQVSMRDHKTMTVKLVPPNHAIIVWSPHGLSPNHLPLSRLSQNKKKGTTYQATYTLSSETKCSLVQLLIQNEPSRVKNTLPTQIVPKIDNCPAQASLASCNKGVKLLKSHTGERKSLIITRHMSEKDIKMSSGALHHKRSS